MARIRGRRTPKAPSAPGKLGSPTPRVGASGVVNHALHDHAVHFIPWVVLGVFWIVGTLLHLFVATTWSRVGAVCLILLTTLGLTYSVWCTQWSRSDVARWHGVTTTILGGSWLALCTITGFITLDGGAPWYVVPHGFTIATFVIGGAGLAAVWNTRISAYRHAAALTDLLGQVEPEVTEMEIAGHRGAVIKGLRQVNEYCQQGTLVLAPGDTLREFQRDLAAVETAHGYPPGSMKVSQRDGVRDARICDVTIMSGDPLEQPQPWPGLVGVSP